jgi:two-component system sensor histidine kinase BaeS
MLGDEARLAQVFGNLVQNTLRYTEEGGRLRVQLSTRHPRHGQPEAEVIWEDSTPGVRDDELPRLTERLFRVESSRSSAGGGSGLGLAIAKAIVDAHGGRMTASHSPLGGLRWSLAFPLESA